MGLLLHQHMDINSQNIAGTDREKTCRNVLTWKRCEIPCHSRFELLDLMAKANGALQPAPAAVPVPQVPGEAQG